jgi:N-acyl-D-amino-acid deacylase
VSEESNHAFSAPAKWNYEILFVRERTNWLTWDDFNLQDAVHRLSGFPAQTLSLTDRGFLKPGYYADIVVFDPATIADRSTFENVHQLAVGVEDVLVNGGLALKDRVATGGHTGRVVRGRGWLGAPGGGCRAPAADWTWTK